MLTILDEATCRINCGGEAGTGFFINGNVIITAKHVIDEFILKSEEGKYITIDNLSNHSEEVNCKYIDHCDDTGIALISVDGAYRHDNYLTLCASEIVEEESIKSYGYPNSLDGSLVGEPLIGKVLRTITDSDETGHDVSISVDNFVPGTYGGFSGSPVMNQYNDVVSFISVQNARYISAVSIKKVASFLRKKSIEVKQDHLASFKEYKSSTFESHGSMQSACLALAEKPISDITPQEIINCRKGGVFYPAKQDSISTLIADIKLNKDLQDSLWSGWLEILTYVEMLKGKYDDFNYIQIEVSSEEMCKRFGIFPVSKTITSKIKINFFFSESKNYFEVARNYIHKAMEEGTVKQDTCNVFNSHNRTFGIQNLTVRDIVLNISDPDNSGPRIPNARIGVLSLQNLRERIINSTDVENAQLNLRERIENALK